MNKSGQSLISVKLDNDILERLDYICSSTGCKRNSIINAALLFALDTCEIHFRIKKVYTFVFNIVDDLTQKRKKSYEV